MWLQRHRKGKGLLVLWRLHLWGNHSHRLLVLFRWGVLVPVLSGEHWEGQDHLDHQTDHPEEVMGMAQGMGNPEVVGPISGAHHQLFSLVL